MPGSAACPRTHCARFSSATGVLLLGMRPVITGSMMIPSFVLFVAVGLFLMWCAIIYGQAAYRRAVGRGQSQLVALLLGAAAPVAGACLPGVLTFLLWPGIGQPSPSGDLMPLLMSPWFEGGFEARGMGTSGAYRRSDGVMVTPGKNMRKTGCFGLVFPAAIFAPSQIGARLPCQRVFADVLLTDNAARAVVLVETKPGAERAPRIVRRHRQLAATLGVAAAMAQIRIVAPVRARCYIAHACVVSCYQEPRIAGAGLFHFEEFSS